MVFFPSAWVLERLENCLFPKLINLSVIGDVLIMIVNFRTYHGCTSYAANILNGMLGTYALTQNIVNHTDSDEHQYT